MTVRERVIASRLIQKIETQGGYAEQIGLSGGLEAVELYETQPHLFTKQKKYKLCKEGF